MAIIIMCIIAVVSIPFFYHYKKIAIKEETERINNAKEMYNYFVDKYNSILLEYKKNESDNSAKNYITVYKDLLEQVQNMKRYNDILPIKEAFGQDEINLYEKRAKQFREEEEKKQEEIEENLKKEEEERRLNLWKREEYNKLAQLKYEFNCIMIDYFIEHDNHIFERVYQELRKKLAQVQELNRSPIQAGFADEEIKVLENKILQFKHFRDKIENEIIKSKLFVSNAYGKVNSNYLNYVCGLDKNKVDSIVLNIEKNLMRRDYDKLFNDTTTYAIIDYLWFYAMHKPYSVSDFDKIKNILERICKRTNIEVYIAEIYAMKQMGGKDVLRNKLDTDFRNNGLSIFYMDSRREYVLTILASSLMWMKAHEEEYMVLKYMLKEKIPMSAKLQERLHSLSNGGGNAPVEYEVKSDNRQIYMDISSLVWGDKDYISFFENMIFQEKGLTYSLAIRCEDKEVFCTKSINWAKKEKIISKVLIVLEEEYGKGVLAEDIKCVALSGNGKENIDGFLIRTTECEQLGIFVHIGCIGKKLMIKFYTLYIPKETNIEKQKQQVISMYKKLSPTVTMWESSLKDTILVAIEQLVNTSIQEDMFESVEHSKTIYSEEIIF